MCGIAGIFDTRGSTSSEILHEHALGMAASLRHRGPDDEGVWADAAAGVALASRRLAILDLSPAGHQPMQSASGRFVLAFNGEIYNFSRLRDEFPHVNFRGHSDTEVVLACFERWGVAESLARFDGMFGIAVWDRSERCLHLARDRFGEKPLYFGWMGPTLLFASELKALRAHPAFSGDIDRDALALYMRHNCIPAPLTIYKKVRKLEPGTFLRIDATGAAHGQTYWSLAASALRAQSRPFAGSLQEATDAVEAKLRDSVRSRMVSDVPLGAFLSGGIDSSTIVALMQAQSSRPVKTFTIALEQDEYNEANEARRIAQHLGTDHTELCVTPQQALDVVPRLAAIYDEPFADSSQIPTFLVSQLARQHVTVALSGDGGDEVFGGYNRYVWTEKLWHQIGWMPAPLRRAVAGIITTVSPQRWNDAFAALGPLLPKQMKHRLPGFKLHKLAGVLDVRNSSEAYLRFVTHWDQPSTLVIGASEPPTLISDVDRWPALGSLTEQMMALDAITYLPDDILVKLDRASMSVSLEARVPMLQPDLLELAWSLPLEMKVGGGTTKRVLREVLSKYVPAKFFERPKWGFGVPLDSWLRGPLRAWAEALLDERRLQQEGFFDPKPIREKWAEHLAGRHWEFHLWDVLMFQCWLEQAAAPASRREAVSGRTS